METIIKELIDTVRKYPKIFATVLAILVVAILFVAYPSIMGGVKALIQDIGKDKPELYNIVYDSTSKTVKGNIKGVKKPDKYRLILFILTDQWYVKPDFNAWTKNGMSELQTKDRFLLNAFTEDQYENDIQATRYAIFLVPSSYSGLKHMNDFDGAKSVYVYYYEDTIP